ncbi:alpha/beta hydrolase [Oxalobacteraceae bacterium CAVE-383]|nr:alpha/beta hydrolase [Oxalobacteraceae bacterium CAVE-383]
MHEGSNEGFLHAPDGVTLFYREWPAVNPRGAVFIAHGLGEHSGRYAELAGVFNALGLSVRAQDHRGHGRSGGARGSIAQAGDFLRDMKQLFDHFALAQHSTPFLFGHSMGGLIAARFATGGFSPVRGLMLSSPALAIYLSRFQRLLLSVGSALAPGLAVATGLPSNQLSHDEAIQSIAAGDVLNHRKVAPRVVRFMLDAIEHCMADAPALRMPVLLQFAGDDALVDPAGSEAFYARLPQIDKTRHRYEHAYHEIFNEAQPLRGQVQQDLREWIEARLEAEMQPGIRSTEVKAG